MLYHILHMKRGSCQACTYSMLVTDPFLPFTNQSKFCCQFLVKSATASIPMPPPRPLALRYHNQQYYSTGPFNPILFVDVAVFLSKILLLNFQSRLCEGGRQVLQSRYLYNYYYWKWLMNSVVLNYSYKKLKLSAPALPILVPPTEFPFCCSVIPK